MSGIFISYRRGDSAGYSGRLFDSLSKAFGKDRVFMDVSGDIEPGVDFGETLRTAVGSCEALVVMIGPQWVNAAGADGERRLDDPEDWVRSEVATALERRIRVIPVLVDGAPIPQAEELPDDLKPLVKRNAIELSATRWDFDVEQLIETLRKVLGEEKKAAFPWLKWAAAAGALALAVLLGWWLWPRVSGPKEVVIPDLTGKTFEQAKAQLIQLALEAFKVDVESEDAGVGTVVSQDPAAAAKRPQGSKIVLRVARLPRVEVPDLKGKIFQDAKRELEERWLTASGATTWEDSRDILEETILAQEPLPGAAVDRGTEIKLTLARYPVRNETGNSISTSYFCAQREGLRCTDVKIGQVSLSDLRRSEIAGKSTPVLYFHSVGRLAGDLDFVLHVWNRKVEGIRPVGEQCQTYTSRRADRDLLEDGSVTVPGATDCLIVAMPADEESSKYRFFSMRSVPGPGLYSAEVQDPSRDRLHGAKRLTIRVVADQDSAG